MLAVRPLAAALLGAAALIASGCAASAKDSTNDFSGAQRDVAQAVEDFQDAAQSGDEEKICNDLLAPALVSAIETAGKAGKGSCPDHLHDSLQDADTFELQVKKVAVTGTTATATVRAEGGSDPHTQQLTLTRTGSPARWRISSLGQ
jgi:hypothetical protein